MPPLLFLSHRIPYPPNKGDKVRSYHLLRHLAARHRIFLATFVDDPADEAHVESLKPLCTELFVARLRPALARARSLVGLASGEPLTVPYYRSRALAAWVDRAVREHGIERAFVFSAAMAQYVLDRPGLHSVVDFVDVDSDKWTQYARTRAWPLSAIFRREGERLAAVERRIARLSDASLFVTPAEASFFAFRAPECAAKVFAVRNGVDAAYFSPSATLRSPFLSGEEPIVFTGAMDYWPNVDAVSWFARECVAQIRAARPAARFYVVGMNPTAAVQTLAGGEGVVVTGRVPDIRPYLQHAAVVVAPLRIQRGVQNKVLEAMAMERPVVVSAGCAASISARAGEEIEVARSAEEFTAKVLDLLASGRGDAMGRAARARVLAEYVWDANLRQVDALLAQPSAERSSAAGLRQRALPHGA